MAAKAGKSGSDLLSFRDSLFDTAYPQQEGGSGFRTQGNGGRVLHPHQDRGRLQGGAGSVEEGLRNAIEAMFRSKEAEKDLLLKERPERAYKVSRIEALAEQVRKGGFLEGWDPGIFNLTVERTLFKLDKTIVLEFHSVKTIEVRGGD